MDEARVCSQEGCSEPGAYRYTWPGKDEALACQKHAVPIQGLAAAMGMHIQTIPLEPDNVAEEMKGIEEVIEGGPDIDLRPEEEEGEMDDEFREKLFEALVSVDEARYLKGTGEKVVPGTVQGVIRETVREIVGMIEEHWPSEDGEKG